MKTSELLDMLRAKGVKSAQLAPDGALLGVEFFGEASPVTDGEPTKAEDGPKGFESYELAGEQLRRRKFLKGDA